MYHDHLCLLDHIEDFLSPVEPNIMVGDGHRLKGGALKFFKSELITWMVLFASYATEFIIINADVQLIDQ